MRTCICFAISFESTHQAKKEKTTARAVFSFLVGMTGFEPATSCSQSTRATNCATSRNTLVQNKVLYYYSKAKMLCQYKEKIFARNFISQHGNVTAMITFCSHSPFVNIELNKKMFLINSFYLILASERDII